ncbi:MAG: hypothetical protein LBP41_00195, partial [Holosporaceae bacterium]|nr:hypothetical protein [Holosporaceae bacterium]
MRKKQKIETRENVVNSFKNVAVEWFEKNKSAMAERHAFYIISRLKANIFPFLGSIPIKSITSKELLAVIRKIEERGAPEVARRTLQVVGQVFRYAIATGRAEHDISRDLRGALQSANKKNYPYFSEKEFQEFLGRFAEFKGNAIQIRQSRQSAWRLSLQALASRRQEISPMYREKRRGSPYPES